MTNAEIAVKIIDIKIAISKIMGKTNKMYLQQYNMLKQNKDKKILEIGMKIQRKEDISDLLDLILLKSIINSPDFDNSAKKLILELASEKYNLLKETADNETKIKLEKIIATG